MSASPVHFVFDRLAAVLNRNVRQSDRARTAAAQLEGRVLSLALEGPPLTLYFRIHEGHVAIETRHEGTTVDASLAGTPIALLSMVGPGAETRLRSAGIHIAGDAEVAQRFRDLLA